MANPEHIAKMLEGVAAWNKWRSSEEAAPDLSDSNFAHQNLSQANLRGADLRGGRFDKLNLSGASLREANLQGVDLSVAKRGLQTEQLAGADLSGAKLPEELEKLYDGLQNVNNISESARKLFLAVLAACLYSWLTIATTTDLNLITNRASSPLPIIQTSIPIVGFYWVAPLLLLCVYFYFHFYLQKLWEELGSLPAIFPDGRPLHAKIDPWLLNDLVRAHLPKLNVNRPFLSYFQLWISVLLAWWVVPVTMFLFWGRYLPRHDRIGTTFHVALLVISLTAALSLYRLAVATLRSAERRRFRWWGLLTSRRGYQTTAFAVSVGVLFGAVSWGAIMGVPSNAPILGISLVLQRSDLPSPGSVPFHPFVNTQMARGPLTWVPRLMALVGYSPFADLTAAEVSQKKPSWNKNNQDPDFVAGAQLKGANLRFASASKAFLAGANLSDADLSGAYLSDADLSDADLSGANLAGVHMHVGHASRANLSGSSLERADLSGADLSSAVLNDAHLGGAHLISVNLSDAALEYADLSGTSLFLSNLTYTILDRAKNLDLETVKEAGHWDKAFYDDEILKALGLPPDHTRRLAEQRAKEKELQEKQNAGQVAPKLATSKQK